MTYLVKHLELLCAHSAKKTALPEVIFSEIKKILCVIFGNFFPNVTTHKQNKNVKRHVESLKMLFEIFVSRGGVMPKVDVIF